MPPVTQQGSRTGLITAVVIFVVLFVAAAIFAIYYGVDATRTHQDFETYKGQFIPKVLPEGTATSQDLDKLAAIRDADNGKHNLNPSMPLLTVATTLRDNLKALVDPTAPDAVQALDKARSDVATDAAKLKAVGVTVSPTEPLIPTIHALTSAVLAKDAQIKTLQGQLVAAQTEAKNKTDQFSAELDKMSKQIEEVRGEATKQEQEAAADRQAKQANFTEIDAARKKEQTALQDQLNQVNTNLGTKSAEAERLAKQLADVRERLTGKRISTDEPIIRHPDGTILRVPGNSIVYISRGSNDQIVPGMTFEVYDKNTGIPRVTGSATPAPGTIANPDEEEKLPEGKASIEVIRVFATSSECRITHTKPGTTSLQEGDLITNLVYDPTVKYRFFVYGKFDLDQNGVPTDQDTAVVKKLISQWGGQLQDKINVDTDFVVLGREPQVPNLNPDEEKDPLRLQERSKAEADLAAYRDVIAKSHELHIPLLNQNRFLYLIGYYDQASRAAKG